MVDASAIIDVQYRKLTSGNYLVAQPSELRVLTGEVMMLECSEHHERARWCGKAAVSPS